MIRFINPNPILRNTVEYYWSEQVSNTKSRVFPDASSSIIFNFGDPISVSTNGKEESKVIGHFIFGPHSLFSDFSHKNSTIIGIKFKQKGTTNFIKESLNRYKNKIIPLNDTPVHNAELLAKKVRNLNDESKIKRILDYYMLVNVDMVEGSSKKFFHACDLIFNSNVKSVKQVCEKCSCSNKHLISLFTYRMGLSPGVVLRINKFLKAMKSINDKSFTTWPQLALECGYYDQAHLINEFKKFSGISPQHFLLNQKLIY